MSWAIISYTRNWKRIWAARMSMTSSRTEMLRNQAASVAAAKDVAARKTGNVDVADDDDTFYDIMSIFNRK